MIADTNSYLDTFFIDYTYSGGVDSEGNLLEVTNREALENAFISWLTASKGDSIRSQSGGFLIPHLGKGMNDDRAEEIKQSILSGISSDFQPALTVVSIDVTPMYEKKFWQITIVAFSNLLRIAINPKVIVRDGV